MITQESLTRELLHARNMVYRLTGKQLALEDELEKARQEIDALKRLVEQSKVGED